MTAELKPGVGEAAGTEREVTLHVPDPSETRALSELVRKKYGFFVKASKPSS